MMNRIHARTQRNATVPNARFNTVRNKRALCSFLHLFGRVSDLLGKRGDVTKTHNQIIVQTFNSPTSHPNPLADLRVVPPAPGR